MRIGPLFKWFGSKWQAAKHYPQPEHSIIIEPYAGGAGYSLNHCDRAVLLNEADPNLVHLWTWLINEATEDLVRSIPVDLPTGTDIRETGLLAGQALLLKHWQRTNNVGDCWTVSPWGHLPGQWTANTRARVAEEVGAIKHWRLGNPWQYVNEEATWFLDPPYLYNYRYRASIPPFDFAALVSLERAISPASLLIVCEAARKTDGAVPDYLPFVPSHRSVTSRRKATQSHHSSEVVYIRRPSAQGA